MDATEIINKSLYQKKFDNFNNYLYSKILDKKYSKKVEEQGDVNINDEDRIIFMGLNSAWEIDHLNKKRASINLSALSFQLDKIFSKKYDDYLKIAIFHHPVIGEEQMNNDFMDLLVIHGFKICMHGHIHQSQNSYFSYDIKKGIHIIGAGTFGAPHKEQRAGIPLQYNIIELYNNEITVHTRKKEKVNGIWEADCRWGDKERPVSHFTIKL